MRPLVVIPTYNESENIERMLHRIPECLPGAGVLVVDDGSPDGTADLVKAWRPNCPTCTCSPRTGKSGLGSAYRAGFAWGLERGYDAFVEIDADFSHDPAALPALVAPLERGLRRLHRLALRRGRLDPELGLAPPPALARRQRATPRPCSGSASRDSTAGFRAYSADILRRLDLDRIRAEGYGFQIEMTYRAKQHGAGITEVPISFVDRAAGESKMSSFIVVEALALVTWWGLGRSSAAAACSADRRSRARRRRRNRAARHAETASGEPRSGTA